MESNLLLTSKTSKSLYQAARRLPIVDYHCHLSPKEIYEDLPFENITQMWLYGDHYKWRLMRTSGIDEEYITGGGDDYSKFLKYVSCVSLAANNPLYIWSRAELEQFFGICDDLTDENAEAIYKKANDAIKQNSLSPRKCIENSNVEFVVTTDDPCDDLKYHELIKADSSFKCKVLPGFRTDALLSLKKPDFKNYLARLEAAANTKITSFENYLFAIIQRLDFFMEHDCLFSDVGIEDFPVFGADKDFTASVFERALSGIEISYDEYLGFLGYMYIFLGAEYKKRGMTMQLHLAVKRNANSKMFNALGADVGGDCVNDAISQRGLITLLDTLNSQDSLGKTIIYTLNPSMYLPIATAAGSFKDVILGAAWWFNDHKGGIEEQLEIYSQTLNIATFTGMLTDSRSFLSYARHDYFRRIFCNFIGRLCDSGEFSTANAQRLIELVCYENAKKLVTKGEDR